MTSGRSMNQVMRRKPCASHWVTKPCLVAYRPSSLVFFCGQIRLTVSSVNASGTCGRVRRLFRYGVLDGLSVQGEPKPARARRRPGPGADGSSSGPGSVAPDLQLRADQRVVVADVDVQVDCVDLERRRGVVLEVDCFGLGFSHPPILLGCCARPCGLGAFTAGSGADAATSGAAHCSRCRRCTRARRRRSPRRGSIPAAAEVRGCSSAMW